MFQMSNIGALHSPRWFVIMAIYCVLLCVDCVSARRLSNLYHTMDTIVVGALNLTATAGSNASISNSTGLVPVTDKAFRGLNSVDQIVLSLLVWSASHRNNSLIQFYIGSVKHNSF